MSKFTVIFDESGSPTFPPKTGDEYFSVGLLIPERPEDLRNNIIQARVTCQNERVKRRGFFHASEDSRDAHSFLVQQLQGVGFYFKMLLADKRAAEHFHKVNTPRHFHRILVREIIGSGVTPYKEIDMLVGRHLETLKSPQNIKELLEYHNALQILEAAQFPYGPTVRIKVDTIRMVTPSDEPLMDVVDYLMWAHQREELRGDESGHLQLRANMSRSSLGGAHRFPGVWRIFTCSTWHPRDPVLARKVFPFWETFDRSSILERVVSAVKSCIEGGQVNPLLLRAHSLGSRILTGDRTTDTVLEFGAALFEVLDTEGVLLSANEEEFCVLKRGAAICCWLKKKKMHQPPIEDWEKMLRDFFLQISDQQITIS